MFSMWASIGPGHHQFGVRPQNIDRDDLRHRFATSFGPMTANGSPARANFSAHSSDRCIAVSEAALSCRPQSRAFHSVIFIRRRSIDTGAKRRANQERAAPYLLARGNYGQVSGLDLKAARAHLDSVAARWQRGQNDIGRLDQSRASHSSVV